MTEREMDPNPSLRLAVAIALLRSKLSQKPSGPSASSSTSLSESDAQRWNALLRSKLSQKTSAPAAASSTSLSESDSQRWKRKAKERKQEILKLKEELKEFEDGTQYDLFPRSASCKCYFFDNLGKLSPSRVNLGDGRFNEVLRRRFLRQVRLKERRKRPDDSVRGGRILELNEEDQIEQLRTSVDFLVEQCKTLAPVRMANVSSFTYWSHQAVDLILASLKNLLAKEKNKNPIEGIVSGLITRLVGRMCTPLQGDESFSSSLDGELHVQHLIRKLGSDPYIGQRTMLAVSQRISVLADSLLFIDPFDDAFPNIHGCMFVLIQLLEFLVSDYTPNWTKNEYFESMLFEEWVRSILHARKSLCLLESRNGLYVLYMDRITGELAKRVTEVSCFPELSPDILESLFG